MAPKQSHGKHREARKLFPRRTTRPWQRNRNKKGGGAGKKHGDLTDWGVKRGGGWEKCERKREVENEKKDCLWVEWQKGERGRTKLWLNTFVRKGPRAEEKEAGRRNSGGMASL